MSRGLVLLAHGARDPRWAEPMHRLRERIAARAPELAVELAFLEHLEPDLGGAIARLAERGRANVVVVPIFLGQGGHVRRDVPQRIEALRVRYPGVALRVAPSVGDDTGIIDAMASYCLGVSDA